MLHVKTGPFDYAIKVLMPLGRADELTPDRREDIANVARGVMEQVDWEPDGTPTMYLSTEEDAISAIFACLFNLTTKFSEWTFEGSATGDYDFEFTAMGGNVTFKLQQN